MDKQAQQELVRPEFKCMWCGERDVDKLVLEEGKREGWVHCTNCQYHYWLG